MAKRKVTAEQIKAKIDRLGKQFEIVRKLSNDIDSDLNQLVSIDDVSPFVAVYQAPYKSDFPVQIKVYGYEEYDSNDHLHLLATGEVIDEIIKSKTSADIDSVYKKYRILKNSSVAKLLNGEE